MPFCDLFHPKCVSGSVHMHIHMDKSPSQEFKNIFVFGTYEYLKRLEGKIRKCLFFYVKIF